MPGRCKDWTMNLLKLLQCLGGVKIELWTCFLIMKCKVFFFLFCTSFFCILFHCWFFWSSVIVILFLYFHVVLLVCCYYVVTLLFHCIVTHLQLFFCTVTLIVIFSCCCWFIVCFLVLLHWFVFFFLHYCYDIGPSIFLRTIVITLVHHYFLILFMVDSCFLG